MKNKLLIMGLCILSVSCATVKHFPNDTTTDTAVRYQLGRGYKKDDATAFKYFSKAANDNDAFAQNELGYLYATGKGTEQNWQKSYYWYEKAAEHGLASAQYNTGLFYYYGLGGKPMDRSKALVWFKKAADRGFVPAKAIFEKNAIQ